MSKSHPSQDLIAIAWGDLSLPSSTLSQLGVLSTSFPLKKKNKNEQFSSTQLLKHPTAGSEEDRNDSRKEEGTQPRKGRNAGAALPYSSIIKIHVSKGCLVPRTMKGGPAQKALSKHRMMHQV